MLTTTFKILKQAGACENGYRKLAKSLGGVKKYGEEKPIPLWKILESNGIEDLFWCADKTQQQKEACKIFRLMASDFAESTLHIFETKNPGDDRPRKAVQAARDFAHGKISSSSRGAAWGAEKSKQYEIAMKYLKNKGDLTDHNTQGNNGRH